MNFLTIRAVMLRKSYWFLWSWMALSGVQQLYGGLSKEMQQEFRQRYEGRALFLGVPVYGVRMIVPVRAGSVASERTVEPVRFKVGEQVRIQSLSFSDQEIRFKLAAIEGAQLSEVVFRFTAPLDEAFSARPTFEASLQQTFSDGRRYSDLDQAKKEYIHNHLEQVLQDMMAGTTADRNFVMSALTESLPAYQTAMEELRQVRGDVKDLSFKLSNEQTKSRQMESKLVEQTSELNRLKSMASSLKTDLSAVNASSSSANSELRQLRQQQTDIQASVRRIQKGMNIAPDPAKSLSRQVEDMMVAVLKNKGESDQTGQRLQISESELEKKKAELQEQLKSNNQLSNENARLQENLKLLSSKGDQLGQRYVNLQKEKGQLENFVRAVQGLRSRVISEKEEKGRVYRTMELLLRETQVAVLEIEYPAATSLGEPSQIRIRFTASSINFVKLSEEEKRILSSLGDKLLVRCELRDIGEGIRTLSAAKELTQSVPERSTGEWVWVLENTRPIDINPVLHISLVNANRDAVPVTQNGLRIEFTNLARMIQGYLLPIPLAIGAVIGMALFAILLAFRRAGRSRRPRTMNRPPAQAIPGRERIEL